MVDDQLTGGAVLRSIRRRYRVSQARLSVQSGVSERTIRNLENGAIASPRTSTLMAMASALDLPNDEIEVMLRAWDTVQVGPPFAEVGVGVNMHAVIREQLLRSFLDKRVVTAHRLIRVGPNRRVCEEVYQTTLEALTDGVDTHTVLARGLRFDQDMEKLIFTDLQGISLRSRRLDPELNMLVVEFDLGRTLRAGERTVISWREINGWSTEYDVPADTRYTNAFMRPITALSMQVLFESEMPNQAWMLFGRERLDRVGELPATAHRTISASWINARPGRFGINWSWD